MNLENFNLWTALITPMTPGLKVDYHSLANIIKEQSDAKNALLILGSTGEALNLDLETRKSIVEFTLEQKPNVPVMVGVGGHDLNAQKAWINWLETKNIEAYLIGKEKRPKYIIPQNFPKKRSEKIIKHWANRWLIKRLDRKDIIEKIESHSLDHPVNHGARVSLPETEYGPLFE